MKYIYVQNGVVTGTAQVASVQLGTAAVQGPAGSTIYTAQDSDPTQVGWSCSVTNNIPTFTAPSMTYPELTPVQFYLSFAPTERMKIKALAASGGVPANSALFANTSAIPQDAVIAEFWATFELALSVNNPVNPNLVSIQEGLAYLASPTAPTPAVITTARIAQISQGIAQ
jgi:hypothetical protein